MAGRRAAVVAGCGLVLAGCWKDNPAFMVTEGPGSSSGGQASGATVDGPDTSTTTTTDSTTSEETSTSEDPSPSTSMTSTSGNVVTSGPDLTTTSTTTSSGDTSSSTSTTTEDALPACGAAAYGPAELRARQWSGLVPQACLDLPGRNYRIISVEGGFVTAVACSADPGAGCSGCNFSQTLQFGFSTPEPAEEIELSMCVYLSAHGAIDVPAPQPCQFKQMALWSDNSNAPGKKAPLVILGHDTVSVDPAVESISAAKLAVQLVPAGVECGCADPGDCCPDKAVEYRLRFVGEEPVEVEQGSHASVKLANATFEAYNGQSFEPGACAQEQRFDWWLLRQ